MAWGLSPERLVGAVPWRRVGGAQVCLRRQTCGGLFS